MTNTCEDDKKIKAERRKYFNKIALAQFSSAATVWSYIALYGFAGFSNSLILILLNLTWSWWVTYSNL